MQAPTFRARLFGVLARLAVCLAMAGVYGVMAYSQGELTTGLQAAPPASYARSAASTRGALNGTRLSLTPVASKTALAMAAMVGFSIVSPAP